MKDKLNVSHSTKIRPRLIWLFSLSSIGVGLLVITGWWLDIALLKSILSGWVTMKFTTALCFVLSGMGLLFTSRYFNNRGNQLINQLIIGVSALLIYFLMVSLLVSVFSGVTFGEESLFVKEVGTVVQTTVPGRPSVGTMVCFLLMASAYLLAITKLRAVEKYLRAAGVIVAILGGVGVLGYVTDIPWLYYYIEGVSTAMALHTAILFVLLGVGLNKIEKQDGVAVDRTSSSLGPVYIMIFGFLFSIVIVSFINLQKTRVYIQESKLTEMNVIADLKVKRIESFFQERAANMKTAQDYFNIKTNLPIITEFIENKEDPKYIAAKNTLDGQLITFQEAYNYSDIILVGLDGNIVYTTNKEHFEVHMGNPLPDLKGMAFEKGKEAIYFSEIFPGEQTDVDFEMLITAPAYDFEDNLIGVIAFEVDMSDIYELIQGATGLGETGETLIGTLNHGDMTHAKGDKEHAIFLNPLRHDPNAALKRFALIGEKDAYPIQKAVQGESGSGISVDYRSEEVLAAWRYIPLLSWGMVAKIDTKEAFAPLDIMRNQILMVTSITISIAIILAMVLMRSVTNKEKVEKRVLELNEILKILNKILRHDILNDLTVVGGNIDLYLQYGKKKVDVDETMKEASEAVKRDIAFIGQMKELEGAVSGGESLKPVKIDEVIQKVSEYFEDMKITIVGEATVLADEALESVITNLVRNAKVHGQVDQVDIGIVTKNNDVVISVADNGKGVPDEVKSKLFVEGAEFGETGHSGLGLYIVKKTIERYGGKVWVEDNKPKGAVFTLQIPKAS